MSAQPQPAANQPAFHAAQVSTARVPPVQAVGAVPGPLLPAGMRPQVPTSILPPIAGVTMQNVMPPGPAGPPHALPMAPAFPVPSGLPNPFQSGGMPVIQQQVTAPPAGPPLAPGQMVQIPFQIPGMPMPAPPAALPQAGLQHAVLPRSLGEPFLSQLAVHLLTVPNVRFALDGFSHLLDRPDVRPQVLSVATGLLMGQELQAAIRDVAAGVMLQAHLSDLFARRLREAIAAGAQA